MGLLDCEVTERSIVINGKKKIYKREYYKFLNKTYFIIPCPEYLQSAIVARFGTQYGVDYNGFNHITAEKESIVETLYIEIEKGKEVANKHKGQEIYSISYDKDYNFGIVFIAYNSNPYYMVNHSEKSVSPIHGFLGAGRDYAKSHNYIFK